MSDDAVSWYTDCHVHVVSSEVEAYPLAPSGIGRGWYHERPVDDAGLWRAIGGVTRRAVLVQAMGAYGYDNSYVLATARRRPDRCRAVVIPDLGSPTLGRDLEAFQARGASGIRLFGIPDGAVLDASGGREAVEFASDRGWTVSVAVLPDDVPRVGRLAARHDDVAFAIDHAGFPDLGGGPPFPNATALWDLAAHENVHVKLTTTLLELASPHVSASVLVQSLLDRFGSSRLVWGSDFPQTELGYGEAIAMSRAALGGLDRHDQDAITSINATRLWFPDLDETVPGD